MVRPLAASNAALDQSIVAKYGAGTSFVSFPSSVGRPLVDIASNCRDSVGVRSAPQ